MRRAAARPAASTSRPSRSSIMSTMSRCERIWEAWTENCVVSGGEHERAATLEGLDEPGRLEA